LNQINKKLFEQIAEKVESDWEMSGLSDGIYYDYALEVAEEYIKVINEGKRKIQLSRGRENL
jgi:hypothetical protein